LSLSRGQIGRLGGCPGRKRARFGGSGGGKWNTRRKKEGAQRVERKGEKHKTLLSSYDNVGDDSPKKDEASEKRGHRGGGSHGEEEKVLSFYWGEREVVIGNRAKGHWEGEKLSQKQALADDRGGKGSCSIEFKRKSTRNAAIRGGIISR